MAKMLIDASQVAALARDAGKDARMNIDSTYSPPKNADVYLQKPESTANNVILSGIRDILTREVGRIIESTHKEALNSKQADILLKVTKMYQVLEAEQAKEELKYGVNGKSDEELKDMAGL